MKLRNFLTSILFIPAAIRAKLIRPERKEMPIPGGWKPRKKNWTMTTSTLTEDGWCVKHLYFEGDTLIKTVIEPQHDIQFVQQKEGA